MSDLDKRIADWRTTFAATRPQNEIEQLEFQLRTNFDSLATIGLSDSERWLVACRRTALAESGTCDSETTVQSGLWRERLLWLLIGLGPLHLILNGINQFAYDFSRVLLYLGLPWPLASVMFFTTRIFFPAIALVILLRLRSGRSVAPRLPSLWESATFGRKATLFSGILLALYIVPNAAMFLMQRWCQSAGKTVAPEADHNYSALTFYSPYLQIGYVVLISAIIALLMTQRPKDGPTIAPN